MLPGNLGRVDYVAEYDYDLYLRPDTSNPRHRMWFNFTVDNAKTEQVRKEGRGEKRRREEKGGEERRGEKRGEERRGEERKN